MEWRMLREPSVFWLPYFFSSPGDCTTRTRDQSASSSSATAIGRLVGGAGAHLGAGGGAGAHLGAVGNDRHQTARVDRDKDVGVADDATRHFCGASSVGRKRA